MLLTGCGGGGGVTSAPPPPPAPPVQSPTYDSFATLARGVSLSTVGVSTSYTDISRVTGTERVALTTRPAGRFNEGGITIEYNAASGTYAVLDLGEATRLANTEKQPNPTMGDGSFATFQRDKDGSLAEYLALYRSGAPDTALELTYTTIAIAYAREFAEGSDNGDLTIKQRLVHAIGGFETRASDMPRSGQASYRTFLAGTWLASDRNRPVAGTADFNVDFATGAVSTALTLTEGNPGPSIGAYSGTGSTYDSTRFTGVLSTTSGTLFEGDFRGAFFGPQAAEFGYAFRLSSSASGVIDGAVVGRKR